MCCEDYNNMQLDIDISDSYLAVPVRQSCPVHPCTQVQFSGAVQFMFKPQPPVQIATRTGNSNTQ